MRSTLAPQATDWNTYYQSVPITAQITRKYTTRTLLRAIERYVRPAPRIVEIGGANSCFIDRIIEGARPQSYDVIDTNEYGLKLLAKRGTPDRVLVRMYCQSILALSYKDPADLVFSVGLVEHFDPVDTRRAVVAHFDLLTSGGVAIITFPTPTLLYRMTRKLLEIAGMWKFPD